VTQLLLAEPFVACEQAKRVALSLLPRHACEGARGFTQFLPGALAQRVRLSRMPDVHLHSNDTFTLWSHSDGCVYRLLWCTSCLPSACTCVGVEVFATTEPLKRWLGCCILFRTSFPNEELITLHGPASIEDPPISSVPQGESNAPLPQVTPGRRPQVMGGAGTGLVKHTILPRVNRHNTSSQFSIYA
jgi:hypothetical protein